MRMQRYLDSMALEQVRQAEQTNESGHSRHAGKWAGRLAHFF